MSTNRKRRTRTLKPTAISPAMLCYFEKGEYDHHLEGAFEVFQMEITPEIKTAWKSCRDEIMADFIKRNPGRRPWAWFEFDGPKHDTGTGAYFEPLPIPRRRIGGKGLTTPEKYPAVVPEFDKGIPASWAEIDPDNPPTFEAEAVFLDRNGLLTAAEKAYLKKHPELLAPETVKIES